MNKAVEKGLKSVFFHIRLSEYAKRKLAKREYERWVADMDSKYKRLIELWNQSKKEFLQSLKQELKNE